MVSNQDGTENFKIPSAQFPLYKHQLFLRRALLFSSNKYFYNF